MHQLITLGNLPILTQFTHSLSKYMAGLYKLYLEYEWPQVLKYHFKSHNHHIVEMQEGVYSGWEHMDADIMSLHLFGHPKVVPAKQNTQPAWSGSKDLSK